MTCYRPHHLLAWLAICVVPSALAQPSVSVDSEDDYHHGDTVTITGAGFTPIDAYDVLVYLPDDALDATIPVFADAAGGFVTTYEAGGAHGGHRIDVRDGVGTVLASTVFFVGSHFRFGTLSWAPVPGSPGEVELRLIGGFRRGYPGPQVIGSIITETIGATRLNFGDGTQTPVLQFRITAFSATENWIIGEALHPGTTTAGVRHTYAGAGPYFANINSSARIAGLNNRSNGAYRLETIVTPLNTNRSPITTLVPITIVAVGCPITFAVPATDPDGDTLRWRLSTSAEAGGGPNPSGALSVNPATGIVSWCTTGLNQTLPWTLQVVIEDLDANGEVKSKTPVDFFLDINPIVGSPPSCDISPSGPHTVTAGSNLSFTFTGTDVDPGALVTLNSGGLPTGATMTPGLPLSGASGTSSTFNWTPTFAQAGSHVVLFSVTDNNGQQSQCSTTITVITNRPPDCDAGTAYAAECAGATTSVQLDGSGSSDPDGDSLTYLWTSNCPGASFDDATSSTPVLTVDTSGLCPSGLSCDVTLTVDDGNGGVSSCQATLSVADTTPPVITLDGDPVVTIECHVGSYTEDGATANDACTGSFAATIGGDTVDTNTPGTYVVTYDASDACGNPATQAARTVIVQDTRAPVVSCSIGRMFRVLGDETPGVWPPNHHMWDVDLSATVSDLCDETAAVTAVTVYCDEDDEDPTGDGTHSPDARDIATGTLRLRAERHGDRDGRVYLIVVSSTDGSGNTGFHVCTVVVPQNLSAASIASVLSQATSARNWYMNLPTRGTIPPGFVPCGDGAVIGPHQ